MGLGPGTWPFENNIDVKDPMTLYLKSLHWSVQTLVTVGFGDIVAFNNGNLSFKRMMIYIYQLKKFMLYVEC